MGKWLMIPPLLLALAVAATPQVRGGFGGGFGRSGFGNHFGFPGANRGWFPGSLAFFGDPFLYPDYSYYPSPAPAVVQPSQPVVIVQSNPNPAPSASPSEPLMIVWQGDHYVRLKGPSDVDSATSGSISSPGLKKSAVPSSAPGESAETHLPPAVLVFRDGHREQVQDYVITSGKLYVRGDYWRDGYWTRTVELRALDLPRTLSANRENGVNFVLPTGPNVVVTRP
jgi:hypothetical protein